MAKKTKEVAKEVEQPIEPKVEAAPKEPTLKTAKVSAETLTKLQDEARLVGYDPKTGEATYKEG